MSDETKLHCQSCGMPLEEPEHFGTKADGSREDEYCTYCYQGGRFTQPDMTYQQMFDFVVDYATKSMEMSVERARAWVGEWMPGLKRWRK